jgi:hypothetical protein
MRIRTILRPGRRKAASALAAVGRREEARKILDALLDHEPGFDRGYALLLDLGGDGALARLDELFAQDQFEERPLIWKAELLRRQNKFEDAEKIESISEHVHLPAKDRDRVAFSILRLDPLQRHAQAQLGTVSDLAGLWTAIEAGRRRLPATPASLYPLAASKAARERLANDPTTRVRRQRDAYRTITDESRAAGPAQALAQTPFVRAAAEMFAGDNLQLLEE